MKEKNFKIEMLNVRKEAIKRINEIKLELKKWNDYLDSLSHVTTFNELEKKTRIHIFALEECHDEIFSHQRCSKDYH